MPDAGWYHDPAGSAQQRWWDGQAWTEHLRQPPAPTPPAAPPTYAPAAAPPTYEPAAATPTYAPAAGAPPTYVPSAGAAGAAGAAWPADGAHTQQVAGNSASPSAYGGPAVRGPSQSPPASRLRPWHLVAVGLVALLIGFLIGNAGKSSSSGKATVSTSTSTSVPVTTSSPPTTAAPLTPGAAGSTYAIGQTAKIVGWSITVLAVHNPEPPSTVAKPASGNHYVAVNVQVTNTSTLPVSWSGVVRFHLLDARGNQYNELTGTGITPPAPTGVIPPGKSLSGLAVFAVPDTTTSGLRFMTQGTGTAPGVIFKLS